ncbi:MFS transporter [Falsarthrobacter nasiphocae]|uniref:MFS family permease n=1 Tax=Falsarthrobacter nasiphocae TaxID=189863 RepID=A0AAE3YGC6_9MICC|nr:MFS transporter [Falsarthrobacter nasiphocae]MDR6891665.1 MFS family permease [Falsarthrobacter nasiphocae]
MSSSQGARGAQHVTSGALLRSHREYRAWFVGDTGAEVGGQLVSLAFALLAFAVTQDLVLAGIVGAAAAGARFVAMLPGGAVIDAYPKRRLLAVYAAVRIVLMLTLVVLILTGTASFWTLLAFGILDGLLKGLFGGLTNAILPFILKGEELRAGLIANETRDSVISVAASPAGGALFGLNPLAPFVADAVLTTSLLWSSKRMTSRVDAAREAGAPRPGFGERMTAGWRWLAGRGDLLAILAILTVSNLGNFLAISSVELGLMSRGVAPWMIGLVFSFFSVGMILGGILASSPAARRRTPRAIALTAFGVQAGAYVLMALSAQWWWIAGLLLVITIPVIAMNSALGAYQMQNTPAEFQGRVGTVFMFVIGLGPVLAAAGAGLLLAHVGWGPTILVAASLSLVALAITALSPHLSALGTSDSGREARQDGEEAEAAKEATERAGGEG